jgi:cholest-4-en-3-one 26-monooxygenase
MSPETRTIDLLDGDFYVNDPYPTYAWMRANAPAYWDSTNELWGISRYDDIVEIEKRKDIFVNSDQSKGGYRPNIPADPAIIGLDDPLHHKRRNLVSRRFTPRAISAWEDHVRGVVTRLLDAVEARGGESEIVGDLAAPLPAMMIGRLLGFDEDAWPDLQSWSERTILMGGGPRYFNEDGMTAAMEFAQASADLYEQKSGCPVDDVMSVWTVAHIDGEPLPVEAVISDCLLVLDGGAETTRTVIARTILNLIERPEVWDDLRGGADTVVATEEFIRFVTPVHNMCRVARADYEVGGETIRPGQQVVLMYPSANRDETHFPDPDRLDVHRNPNNHLAFGFGTHFCLGNSLARLELVCMFEHVLRRLPDIELVDGAEPGYRPANFISGYEEMRVRFTPTEPVLA